MNTDPITSALPPLQAEVYALLAADGGWLTRHVLLGRCRFARDASTLADALDALIRRKLIQRETGDLGLEYAKAGVEPRAHNVREARGPSYGSADPVDVRPSIVAIRHQSVQAKLEAVRDELVRLFKARPNRTRAELQAILGKSQPTVNNYLRAMRKDGQIEQRSTGPQVYYAWVGDIAPRSACEASGRLTLSDKPELRRAVVGLQS